MKNYSTYPFKSLIVAIGFCLVTQFPAHASNAKLDLDSLVNYAQQLVYSNPTKIDSAVKVIERHSIAIGDSSYYCTIRSLQGIRSSMLNDYGPALKYFYDVWKFSKRRDDSVTQVSALTNMSGVCQMSGRYRDAKSRLQLARALNPDDNAQIEGQIVMALGMAEVELSQFDSAVTNFKVAVEIFDELGEEHYVLSCMNELGYALESQHLYHDALDIYKRMEVLYKFTEDATGEIVVNQRKGNSLMHIGRMKEAIVALEHSLVLADSMEYESQKDSTLLRLVKAHASLGNIDGAERYTKRLMGFIREKEQRKNEEMIAFVEAKYNLEEKARVNESLASELKTARADLSRTHLYLRFAIAAIIVLFLSVLVLFRRFSTIRQ